MMNEQIVQMGLMWVLAGLSAGWLAETCISRRGYGLVVDMGLGVGAGLAGGGVFLATYLLRGVPLDLQRAARVRAVNDGTTLRQVLLKGLGEYAAGTWTPQTDDTPPVALTVGGQATRR